MNKFSEVSYTSPKAIKMTFKLFRMIGKFSRANTYAKQSLVFRQINNYRNEMMTDFFIIYMRNMSNVNDEHYANELKKGMSAYVVLQMLNVRLYKKLLKARFRDELEKEYGKQIFNKAEKQANTMSLGVILDMQKEFVIAEEYNRIVANAKINFRGEELTVPQLSLHMQSADNDARLEANQAYAKFFETNEEKFDDIFDRLVKLRDKIAKKLGYDSYTKLTYDKLSRDYTPEEVAAYRKAVEKYIIPVTEEIRKNQAQRIGVDSLKFSDESFKFPNGNANPKGDANWIVEQVQFMYNEISADAGEYFKTLVDREFLDLESRAGKKQGGIAVPMTREKMPFVYTNANGTFDDVRVLVHECGHGYQELNTIYRHDLFEYILPTFEACEVHSMSMEFLAWPWYDKLFGEGENKAKFTHLSNALLFIPFGVTVDEFQHFVYDNPTATKEERKAKWAEIEKKYMPSKDYTGTEFFSKGTYWFKQPHLFNNPFYYVDYTLAQICAFQIWSQSEENFDNAWKNYYQMCITGGSEKFVDMLKKGNVESPFEEETIKDVVKNVVNYLDSVDQVNL